MDKKIDLMRIIVCYLVFFNLIISCADNKALLLENIRTNPLNSIESHSVNIDKKFIERIIEAPPVIISSLNKMDSTGKYSSYKAASKEIKMFSEYYELLPEKFKDVLTRKVIAVYLIKDFTGGGMSDYVFDKSGVMFIVLYLNAELFHTSLSDWITYRDQSAFTESSSNKYVKAYCGKGNTGLLHTLVHEASHIYDFYYHITPFTDPFLSRMAVNKSTVFVFGVWENYNTPVKKYDFTSRSGVYSYGLGKKVDISMSADIYRDLNRSPFSSLYGSSSWAEDFAETFTWYYLNNKFGIKYRVTVTNGADSIIFSPADNKSVTERYKILEMITDQK